MPRDLPVGNGNVLIAFDRDYLLRELYFPHVGEESHTKGEKFRFGVFVSSQFSWIPDGWSVKREYLEDCLVTNVELVNEKLGLRIVCNDAVDFHENIYIRKLAVENLFEEEREVRLFFCQDFHISGNEIGNTAEFRPRPDGILHYKSDRYFLVGASLQDGTPFNMFATGHKISGLFDGTWKDAEDGVLGGNPIAQGSVDSVIGISLYIKSKSVQKCFYRICCGKNWEEVEALDKLVKKRGHESFLKRTEDYWKLWVNKVPFPEGILPPEAVALYKKSLLIARSQINNCGSIIAGNDSDVMQFNRDTYSYMWPRDGALTANAFDLAGYDVTRSFYEFCNKIIDPEGFFRHKYTPSGSPGSSWHPWVNDKLFRLPIQEDETALVLWALWEHYSIFKDVEFIKPLYKNLIKRSADFMMNYRDLKTGLPLASYDLWEERLGVSAFTVSAVYAGLIAAANFTEKFGELELSKEYREGAALMRGGMDKYLYLEKEKRFARMLHFKADGAVEVDSTLDASLYAVFAFGAYAPDDEKVKNTMDQVYEKLWDPGGGLARYEGDAYYRSEGSKQGNPWFVTTLWIAQYRIAASKNKQDLEKALEIIKWVTSLALPSGVLAEQIHPFTHEPLSVSPLTWSHATYITVIQEYLRKFNRLQK